MSMEEKIELFGEDWPGYQEEAEERWGNTPEWEQSQAQQKTFTREDWENAKKEQDDFLTLLKHAATSNVRPGSEEAAAIVATHRASIARFYEITASKQVLLARMYTVDERFNQTYQGHAEYLLTLIEKQAEQEGVNLNDVQWD